LFITHQAELLDHPNEVPGAVSESQQSKKTRYPLASGLYSGFFSLVLFWTVFLQFINDRVKKRAF